MKKIRAPCEIIMWEIVPVIRKELAKILVKEYNFNQKKAAEILGISEAAVSQYINKKRGKKIKLDEKDVKKIKKIAEHIVKKHNESTVVKSICNACRTISYKKIKERCNL